MEYTSDLRSDAVRIEGSNPSWSTIKEIMQFERVTSRNWYTHLIANQTPLMALWVRVPLILFCLFLFLLLLHSIVGSAADSESVLGVFESYWSKFNGYIKINSGITRIGIEARLKPECENIESSSLSSWTELLVMQVCQLALIRLVRSVRLTYSQLILV